MKHGGGSQRWLVSYADMVTLLFALFLVLFAVSSVDNSRLVQVADALDQRLKQEQSKPLPQVEVSLPSTRHASTRSSNDHITTLNHLESRLSGYDVKRTARGLAVSLASDGILFESGQAHLKTRSELVLRDLLVALEDSDLIVRIEGHTDSQPIHTEQFQSNWELSVMRAWAVARYFVRQGISAERISIMGFGSEQPVAPNTTAEGRAKNRRVVLYFQFRSDALYSGTMKGTEENGQRDGSTVTSKLGSGAISVWTADTAHSNPAGGGPHDTGVDHLVHQDNSGLGPY